MKSPADKLREIVDNAKGHDLECAESSFRRYSITEMFMEYGQSGQTRQEVLDGYRRSRREWQAARDLLEKLLD